MEVALLFFVIIVLAVALLLCFFKRKKQGEQVPITPEECKDIVDKALKSLNCKPEWQESKTEYNGSYVYQAGFFRVRIEKNSRYVDMAYMYMFETQLTNLDAVRDLCNNANKRAKNERIIYSVNGEKNLVDVHIISTFNLDRVNAEEVLQVHMRNVFGWRNMFYNEFSRIMNDMANTNIRDLEKASSEWSRKNFLVHEHELLKNSKNMRFRENNYDHLLLSSFMRNVFSNETVSISSIFICVPDMDNVKITDTKDILSYHLSDSIIRKGRKIHDHATLIVDYKDESLPGIPRTAVLYISYENGGKKAMYYRVSVMQVPVMADDIHNSNNVISVVVAYDTNDKKQNYYEFLYLWKEAKEKKNEEQKLTTEEQLLSYTDDENNAYNMFKGRQLFLEHRYYEAVPYLESVYEYMSESFTELRLPGMSNLYEVCFMLGTAYCDMKDYERAVPYLATTLDAENIGLPIVDAIRYKKEYVNCLVNSGDYRAMKYIFDLINTLEATMKYRDISVHWIDFLKFLKRRYVQILINKSLVDEAEIELKDMLNDPDNKDFALNELAYLQKTRKKQD